jgi:hypothetical protein
MRKRTIAILCVAIAAGVLSGIVGVTSSFHSSSSATSYDGFYMDLGASASLGFQPTGIPKHNGHRTNTGYANDLVAIEASKGVSLQLFQFGCPGETAESMLGEGDACYKLPERQLLRATSFLSENTNETGVVTIDLGFNNVRACLASVPIDEACAARGIQLVSEDMPPVLTALKAAAGASVHFVGLEYGDPFLGYDVNDAHSELAASQSLEIMTQLNMVLAKAYANAGIAIANVPGAYKSFNTTPISLPGVGTVPTNVAEACAYTWFCTGYPYGPDDHPNNAGYKVIAQTIASTLPAKL